MVPWVLIGNVASLLTVTTPAQLSVAVGADRLVTVHSSVTSASIATSGTGAVTSAITTFWV